MLLYEKLTKTQKKYLNIFIKLAVVGLAMWYIFVKLNNQKNLHEFQHLIQAVDPMAMRITMAAVLLLMLANWFLEVVKWKFLSKRIEPISWWKAIQSVFCGLTWAIFTPNRIGEYGGRVMLLKADNRASGAVAMGVGQFAQLVMTSIFGALSIAWFVQTFIPCHITILISIWAVAILYALGFLVLYFNVHWIDRLVGRFRFMERIRPFFSVLDDFTRQELRRVLFLSAARFAIFTSQYIILMLVIIPGIPVVSMVILIFILFFIQSAVPSLDIFDFSVRSFVASNLYSYITSQEIAVMAIVSCIWFVNLILPAIIGSFFVLNVNYIGSNKS